MSETSQGPVAPPQPQKGALEELFDRGRVRVALAVLVVEVAVFAAGLLIPLSPSTQQSLAQQANTEFSPLKTAGFAQTVYFIFSHNLTIALGETVPLLGALFLLFSIYSTGLVGQALMVAQGLPGPWAMFLFAFPDTIVELSGYAIAAGSGVMLLVAWRRKRLHREARVFGLELASVAGVLLVAATMETTLTFYPLLGLTLWIPTALAVVAIAALARRHGRKMRERREALLPPPAPPAWTPSEVPAPPA
ncbi:MAG: stage II sporulation protein M [Nitrososphaerota archaeon]|nr:stage II sporulation protein M [Nitrososphaerota archaeon]